MNLLIYYNPNQNNFYIVYSVFLPFDKKVGYENGYGHILVQILAYHNGSFLNVKSYDDYYYVLRKSKEGIKSRLANKAIRWLNKYRE